MGEFDMYRQAGTTPNFTDIARRYGMNRHTVAKYWKAGGQVEDARRCRPSGLDRHREVIEAKAQLPGATKRGIYEYLIDRCYAGEEPPAYNTLTKWMRRNGIECGVNANIVSTDWANVPPARANLFPPIAPTYFRQPRQRNYAPRLYCPIETGATIG